MDSSKTKSASGRPHCFGFSGAHDKVCGWMRCCIRRRKAEVSMLKSLVHFVRASGCWAEGCVAAIVASDL